MKTNVQLFYDEACPFCVWYSQQLVNLHLISQECRVSYQQNLGMFSEYIDQQRATSEIACFNQETSETYYGLNSLLYILSERFPRLVKVCHWKPVFILLRWLYAFISFNRKIIFPGKNRAVSCACEPQRSVTWRGLFIIVLTLLTSLQVNHFFHSWLFSYLQPHPQADILLLCLQLAFQACIFTGLKQESLYHYLGHLTFVSFSGSILLSFGSLFLSFTVPYFPGISWLAPVIYGITLLFMFQLHATRLKQNNWSSFLSLSWILFRLAIYPLVFKL